jgi:F0F1-type ATP synthase assembly protein I
MSSSPLVFAGFGMELAALVVVGGLAGYWLDGWWSTEPWLVVLGATAGMVLGMWNLVRRMNRWNRQMAETGKQVVKNEKE